ncbi:uncharacterized protein BDV17DRAFT_294477 [Aspergillus undulatus]|uniref:uncharacterized protein n=1 Tax=Aspergillus undulatus TaxID=1810928 RepID=UPI003CCD6AD7
MFYDEQLHSETFLAACNQNPQLLEACVTVVDEEMRRDSVSPTDPPRSSLTKYLSQNSTSNELSSIEGKTLVESSVSLATTSSSKNSFTLPWHERRRSSQSRGSYKDPTSGQQQLDSVVIRRACRYDCYCRCHEQQSTVEPSGKPSRLNARAFREGTRPKLECSDPTCAAAVSSKTTIPVFAFKRAMGRFISSNYVKIHLKTYRTVPVGSNAMQYVKHGYLDKLKLAIQSSEATPWDTAPDGWSLLHTAVYARHLPTVQYLVQLGAETEVSDLGTRKPIDLAFLKSRDTDATQIEKDIVQVFSNNDDFIDDYVFTLIHLAVLDLYDPSDLERPTLKELIDFMDEANSSPPAQGCLVGCVKLLLDAGADRNIRRENQQVALHYAGLSDKQERRRETVALVCEGGKQQDVLEIDAQDEDGRPPMFDFVDDLECLKLLIRNGVGLTVLDNHENSILHHACMQGEKKSLIGLLQLFTDPSSSSSSHSATGSEERRLTVSRGTEVDEGSVASNISVRTQLPGLDSEYIWIDALCIIQNSEVYDSWLYTAVTYSSRQLTKCEDRFPALGGLARAVKEYAHSDEYVAGIWAGDMRRSLGWTTSSRNPQPQAGHGPPFSGTIQHNRTSRVNIETQGAARLDKYMIELSKPDPFGQIESTELYIKAQVLDAVLSHDKKHIHDPYQIQKYGRQYGGIELDLPAESESLVVVQCILLFFLNGVRGIGLAIVPVEGRERTYRRVGLLTSLNWASFQGLEKEIILV